MQPNPIRMTKAQAWASGNLSYKFHAGQQTIEHAFNYAPGKLFVGNCARQFGKTAWAVMKACEQANAKKKARIRIGAAFQSDLEEFILPAFDFVLDDCPHVLRPRYNANKSKYIFPNGSEIKLVGLDKNPNGLRGNALDLIIIDECGFVSRLEYLYRSVLIPSTTHRPNARIILLSTPPETPAHDFNDFCGRAEVMGAYVVLDVYKNPMLKPEQIKLLMDECGGEESTAWQREYLCKFIVDSERAIIPEWDDKYIEEPERDPLTYVYLHRYEAMDIGFSDFTATLFAYYDFKRATIVVEEELTLSGPAVTTRSIATNLRSKERKIWANDDETLPVYRRVADNNNLILLQDLSTEEDLNFVPTNKELLTAMVNQVRVWVKDGRLRVSPKCKMLLGCLKYGVWDKHRKGFDKSKIYRHFDHLAALVYLIRNVDETTNPIPPGLGIDMYNTVYRPTPRLSPAGKALASIFGRKLPR